MALDRGLSCSSLFLARERAHHVGIGLHTLADKWTSGASTLPMFPQGKDVGKQVAHMTSAQHLGAAHWRSLLEGATQCIHTPVFRLETNKDTPQLLAWEEAAREMGPRAQYQRFAGADLEARCPPHAGPCFVSCCLFVCLSCPLAERCLIVDQASTQRMGVDS